MMAHGDAREGKWRENWRMEWVASTLHTTSEHGVSSITTADAHTSAANSRMNWRPRWFKRTRPFRRKTKSGFCGCATTFQLVSAYASYWGDSDLHSRPEDGIFWLQYFVIFFVSLSKLKYREDCFFRHPYQFIVHSRYRHYMWNVHLRSCFLLKETAHATWS